ncbi:MAG TPA: DEAD/DEAH box helicase [Anaerolineae bacterium]|nr:DEAD/DEAH box helicase [Anaerolineae bacterium]
MPSPHTIKKQIPHTWPLFFRRHGHFTPIQERAIPPILQGQDALLISATASGKTEAALAPLIERHWPNPFILYLCPTRALVQDLYQRIHQAFTHTHLILTRKTGDGTNITSQPPNLLITTPESLDVLVTNRPRLWPTLRAVVLDEIHLLDNTIRGDQTRCLLQRIKQIQTYYYQQKPHLSPPYLQTIALSATISHPAGIADRYLTNPQIIQLATARSLHTTIAPLFDLTILTTTLAQRAASKSLIFCNSRDEVEQVAAYLNRHPPHEAQIFVHYSHLDSKLRQQVEERFAQAPVAICVATSTLELGIDIGTIDDIVLIGAPADLNAFQQRIGRGNRRNQQISVLCIPKNPSDWAQFDALIALSTGKLSLSSLTPNSPQPPKQNHVYTIDNYHFRPSVIIQQIFSRLKQSPTGAIRLADIPHLLPIPYDQDELRAIIAELVNTNYLQPRRMGEWVPAPKLQELFDEHTIYSNIGADALSIAAIDAFTGKTLAYTQYAHPPGTTLLFGGQLMRVVWQEQRRFGLTPTTGHQPDDQLRWWTTPMTIPFAVSQALGRLLHLPPQQLPFLPDDNGGWLFHFWGTIWGNLLADILSTSGWHVASITHTHLYLHTPITQLPTWSELPLKRLTHHLAPLLSNRLNMGRFHSLLPTQLATQATAAHLNLPQLAPIYNQAVITPRPDLAENLHPLLS